MILKISVTFFCIKRIETVFDGEVGLRSAEQIPDCIYFKGLIRPLAQKKCSRCATKISGLPLRRSFLALHDHQSSDLNKE